MATFYTPHTTFCPLTFLFSTASIQLIRMLMIRLQRMGKKHDPSYRVALIDSRRAAKSGGFNENLGSYNPQKGEPALNARRIKEWLAKGAQVSDTVHNLLVKTGVVEGEKRDVLSHDRIKAKLAKRKGSEPVEAAK